MVGGGGENNETPVPDLAWIFDPDADSGLAPPTVVNGNTISVAAPNGWHPHAKAPAGCYMLFIISGGVRSRAKFILLHRDGDNPLLLGVPAPVSARVDTASNPCGDSGCRGKGLCIIGENSGFEVIRTRTLIGVMNNSVFWR